MPGTSRKTRLGWLLAPVLALATTAGCGGGGGSAAPTPAPDAAMAEPDSAPVDLAPQIMVAPAPAATLLRGMVSDSHSGVPLAGVTVSAAGLAPVTSGVDGRFELPAAPGLLALELSVAGYFGWARQIAAIGNETDLDVRLVKKASEVAIPSGATTTLAAGAASFSVPPGAFSGDVTGSVAYIPPTQIGASPGPVQFQDASQRTHRVLGVLNVDLPAAPGVPVTVKAPVPAGTPQERLFLFRLVSGAWADPIAATALEGGVAHFATVYTGSVAVVERSPEDAFVVTSRSGAAAAEGDLLVPGTMITPAVVPVAVETPHGDLIEIPAGQTVTLAMMDEPGASAAAPSAARVLPLLASSTRPRFPVVTLPARGSGPGSVKGVVRPRPAPSPEMPKIEVRGWQSALLRVRGGVFYYSERPCGAGTIVIAEVSNGSAELVIPGQPPVMLPAGTRLVSCINCGRNSASADGICQEAPAPGTDAGVIPPPADAGARPGADDASRPPITGTGGSPGSDPMAGTCSNGGVCHDGAVCEARAADGSLQTCRCDRGRFICAGSAGPSRDGGVTPPPPVTDAAPESCGHGLACSDGSICRGTPAPDGTVAVCKCDAGRYFCALEGTGPRADAGVPTPSYDGAPPPPPADCAPGLMCVDGSICRGAPSPDGSTLICKCAMGSLICERTGGTTPGTGGAGGSGGYGGAGGYGGSPATPTGCQPGLMCAEGSACRGEIQPDGSFLFCKCDLGKLTCAPTSALPPPGTGGATVTPPPPAGACKPGLTCQEGFACRGEIQPDGSALVCKCSFGTLACEPTAPAPVMADAGVR